MTRLRENDPSLRRDAAAWLARRDAGLTPEEEVEFECWAKANPGHAAVFIELESAWSAFDTVRTSEVDFVRRNLVQRQRRRRWRRVASMAGLAAAIVVAAWWQSPSATRETSVTARVLAPVREILADGSVAEFPLEARIEPEFTPSRRELRLVQGEAHFAVRHDPGRPFVVHAGSVRVRAVGTAFTVWLGPDAIEVVVTEGRVAVEPDAAAAGSSPTTSVAPTLVDAGHSLAYPVRPHARGMLRPVPVSPQAMAQRLAWRSTRLEFTDTPLIEAAGLFNRYHRVPLRIGDAATGSLQVTGIFRADNVEGFVNVLETSFGVRVERRTDSITLKRQADGQP